MEELLLTYGPLGASVLALAWYVMYLTKEVKGLNEKRFEDYKMILTALNSSAERSQILAEALDKQGELIEALLKTKRGTK